MSIDSGKVLICDDSILARKQIKDIVSIVGNPTILEAGDGEGAIEMYKAHKPDLVFLDIVMPKKDGNMAIQEIMAYDKDGNKIADIEVSGWGSQLFVGENGQIYYSYMDEVNWEQLLVPVDIAGNKAF